MRNPIFNTNRRYWKGQIRVGDVVKVRQDKRSTAPVGIVINTWTNHKNLVQSVDVLWGDGSSPTKCHDPSVLEIICK